MGGGRNRRRKGCQGLRRNEKLKRIRRRERECVMDYDDGGE